MIRPYKIDYKEGDIVRERGCPENRHLIYRIVKATTEYTHYVRMKPLNGGTWVGANMSHIEPVSPLELLAMQAE